MVTIGDTPVEIADEVITCCDEEMEYTVNQGDFGEFVCRRCGRDLWIYRDGRIEEMNPGHEPPPPPDEFTAAESSALIGRRVRALRAVQVDDDWSIYPGNICTVTNAYIRFGVPEVTVSWECESGMRGQIGWRSISSSIQYNKAQFRETFELLNPIEYPPAIPKVAPPPVKRSLFDRLFG